MKNNVIDNRMNPVDQLLDRKKRIAIVQSNYIPWKGYFDIIKFVDEFIVYDDVQFTKNGGHNLPPFTLVNVNILDELWEGCKEDDSLNTNNLTGDITPGFELIFIIFPIILIIWIKRSLQKSK